jgi:hypothetical protein
MQKLLPASKIKRKRYDLKVTKAVLPTALLLDNEMQQTYYAIPKICGHLPTILNDGFQLHLVNDKENDWECHSGARYFHVDENGLVTFSNQEVVFLQNTFLIIIQK